MAKYIANVSGSLQEVSGVASSAGGTDAGKIVQLDGTGKLDASMMPTGIGADTKSVVTSENLSIGNLVNIYDNSTVATARKADCSTPLRCVGFVLSGTTSGASALVYFEGTIPGQTGLTIGNPCYLTTAGAITQTPPTTAGYILQEIGVATSATEVSFEPQMPIILA